MCESCSKGVNRRDFIKTGSLTASFLSASILHAAEGEGVPAESASRGKKQLARVKAVFLYPLPEDCDAGKAEASWQEHHWHPYPGNQFDHRAQRKKFTEKIAAMAKRIGVEVDFAPKALSWDKEVAQYIADVKADVPNAMLILCLSSASLKKAHTIAKEIDAPSIVYLPTGANHHLPPSSLTEAKRLHFIHSIENWDEIERSLRAVHAKKMLTQSRVLRVGGYGEIGESTHKTLGTKIATIPAGVYNRLFDSIQPDDAIRAAAMRFKKDAAKVMDVTDERFVEAFRAHRTVSHLLDRYAGDAITIDCLHLRHRKPCVSFSIHNGELTASCGCENDITATMTLLLNRYLFSRGGFEHNPEYDEVRNQYFATHCTCATKLQGPDGPAQEYLVRPFFHHLPKTAALDVQWTPDAPVILAKMFSESDIRYFTGKVIDCPKCPPTGGCATRVLVDFGVPDVLKVYMGSHPILFFGEPVETRAYKIFSRLFEKRGA